VDDAGDRGYRRLLAWSRGIDLVEATYLLSRSWPSEERFGLTSQARRAATSIPGNVAEGAGRTGDAEMRHRLSIAHGSLCELETHFVIAQRLGFISSAELADFERLSGEVGRLVRGLILRIDRDAQGRSGA
jgi:four helix bundle protein